MFTILDYSSALEYNIIRRYTNIVYYYYYVGLGLGVFTLFAAPRDGQLSVGFSVSDRNTHVCVFSVLTRNGF